MKKNIALLIAGGVLTWLGLCLSVGFDMWREAHADWKFSGKSCTPDCACKCQQVTCGCHLPRPKPKSAWEDDVARAPGVERYVDLPDGAYKRIVKF